MRSSFTSSYSSSSTLNPLSTSSPLSYSSSSSQLGYRRSSATGSHGLTSRAGPDYGSPFQRDSSNRESLPGRLYPNRSSSLAGRSQEPPIPSRVTRDEQTIGLLERYGNGARKTSVGESSNSQYFKQRRQQQFEPDSGPSSSVLGQRRTSLETSQFGAASSPFSPFSRDQPSTSGSTSLFGRDGARKQPPDAQDVNQNEYMQRLLAAHNRVDDLLKSRGLSGEDERKYLRAWEEIPIIREERYRRVRTPSNSSDSGLSTDNDSDRSNAEAAPPEPPTVDSTDYFSFEKEEEDIQIVHNIIVKAKETAFYSEKLNVVDFNLQKNRRAEEKASKSIHTPSVPDLCHLSVTKAKEFSATNKKKKNNLCDTRATFPSRVKESVSVTLPAAPTPKVLMNARQELKKTPEKVIPTIKEAVSNCAKSICANFRKETASKLLEEPRAPLKVSASFSAGDVRDKLIKPALPKRRKTYDDNVKVQQKNVLASLKRKKMDVIPSTAEISIQHCSFYNQLAKDNFAEKNVRLNLRMTERAPKNCHAQITLPSPPRVIYVRKDISIFSTRPPPRRTKTQEIPKPKVGRLNRAFTVELEKEEKEIRKVNRLKIPEYFLQSNAEMLEDIMGVKNGLKRVPIIGGFLIQPKEKPAAKQPQSTLRRSGAIRRRPTPIKEESSTALYSDFCPPQTPKSPVPAIRIVSPLEPDPPLIPRRRPPPASSSKHLNLHGSLALSAKPRGAAKTYESKQHHQNFAELSETDKLLIERFSSRMHIPRPKAIIRALSPFNAIRALKSQIKERCSSPPPRFIQRRAPRMRSPTPARETKPIRLNSAVLVKKQQPRRHWLDFQVDLKRVDYEKHRSRLKPRRRLMRWIPRWRRRGTDEEVEEVDEEEVEADYAPSETGTTRSDRPKTKSFTEDEEGLTEGERAMAAAKRRHEEEQHAKLQDYEERRRAEREKEEEELKKLKEKQERRKLEREQEEREMEERRRAADDRRRQEEEERKAKVDQDRKNREEEKNKKNQLSGFQTGQGGRNFTIPKKNVAQNDKFGNIVQAKQEMGMTKEQQDEAKRRRSTSRKPSGVSGGNSQRNPERRRSSSKRAESKNQGAPPENLQARGREVRPREASRTSRVRHERAQRTSTSSHSKFRSQERN